MLLQSGIERYELAPVFATSSGDANQRTTGDVLWTVAAVVGAVAAVGSVVAVIIVAEDY